MQAERLRQLPPYLFEEIDRKVAEARKGGAEIIDLGVGDPDTPTDPVLVEALKEALDRPEHHQYAPGRGLARLRRKIADWIEPRTGFRPDPETEILITLGSKEAIGHLPLALLEPGQSCLVPDPGYPVYSSGTVFAGGVPVTFPLTWEGRFLPDLENISVGEDTRLCFVNYPNNPTGATAEPGFYRDALSWAKRHALVLANDAAYSELVLDEGASASTLLQACKNLSDPVIEFYSFSKMYHMTGWRIGYAVGNRDIISALAKIKANLDSGCFGAIQDAVLHGLSHHHERIIRGVRKLYRDRMARMSTVLRDLGYEFLESRATFYLWIRVPGGDSSIEFAERVLEAAGIVVSPGIGFGSRGEGYFRLSLTATDRDIDEACRRFQKLGAVAAADSREGGIYEPG